jgi:putative FmdB family regulatory protein
MPIYEYRCASCGHELEALQKLSDAALSVCPACHKAELKKLMSAAGFQLKGSGWYATDFRNSGKKPPAKGAAAKTGNGETSDASSADATNGAPATDAKASDGKATEAKPAAAAPESKPKPAPTTSSGGGDS